MADQLQLRQGTSIQCDAFIGAVGEPFVDTTNTRVRISDGVTLGGFAAAKLDEVITNTRTAVSDVNYSAVPTDRIIAYVTLTAARQVGLPMAASYPTGTILTIVDESSHCSPSLSITINANGSDTIVGSSSITMKAAYGYVGLQTNGVGLWTVVSQDLASMLLGLPQNPVSPLAVGKLFMSGGLLEQSQ